MFYISPNKNCEYLTRVYLSLKRPCKLLCSSGMINTLYNIFTFLGNYLYSGGIEAVLVKWTLGNLAYKANEKAFIPRLPGVVRYITTNNTHVAITLSNNCKFHLNIILQFSLLLGVKTLLNVKRRLIQSNNLYNNYLQITQILYGTITHSSLVCQLQRVNGFNL